MAFDEYQKMQEELEVQKECREQLEEITAEVQARDFLRSRAYFLS